MKTNKEMFDELEEFIVSVDNKPSELIAILHRAQSIFGYLPMNVQSFIACKLGINVSKVYGVVTFYSFFTMVPKGEYVINICLGTACFVRGADKILERVEEILKIKNNHRNIDNIEKIFVFEGRELLYKFSFWLSRSCNSIRHYCCGNGTFPKIKHRIYGNTCCYGRLRKR